MKKLIAICFIIVGLIPWQARSGENDRLELALKIVEKTNAPKLFVDLSETFMEPYFERYEMPGHGDRSKSNPLKQFFLDEVTQGREELTEMLAEIYAAHFTESELRQILAFFESPAGTTWLDKHLIIQTEGEQVGLEWGQLLIQRVLNRFEAQTGEKF